MKISFINHKRIASTTSLTVLIHISLVMLFQLLSGCSSVPSGDHMAQISSSDSAILIAHLGRERGDDEGFRAIRDAFSQSNSGYNLAYFPNTKHIPASDSNRIVFVQEETAGALTIPGRVGNVSSETGGGDIILLSPNEELTVSDDLDFLVFEAPVPFPKELPRFIRPDWDDQITDTPGGCATETGAYRRILLTWLEKNGPYTYHALNAHRVRITDSFSHYHPLDVGFDEFYFVQMVQPNGRIIVSKHTSQIEDPTSVNLDLANQLLETHHLEVGYLVYIPRGVVHRGVGGVLAQVISVPGFRPNAEIGVDHYLKAINENLSLVGANELPLNEAASSTSVVK